MASTQNRVHRQVPSHCEDSHASRRRSAVRSEIAGGKGLPLDLLWSEP
jgi:hypothetical protein